MTHTVISVITLAILMWFIITRKHRSQHPNYADIPSVSSIDRTDPSMRTIPEFLTQHECTWLIAEARRIGFRRSTVIGVPGVYSRERTSKTVFIGSDTDITRGIKQKASTLSGLPVENIEDLQVVRYKPHQEFRLHHDYFTPNTPGANEALLRGGQRIVTLFVYLNNVPVDRDGVQRGHTVFPRLNVRIRPSRGTALMFWDARMIDGKYVVDDRTEHAGETIHRGVKYGLNIWIRERAWN